MVSPVNPAAGYLVGFLRDKGHEEVGLAVVNSVAYILQSSRTPGQIRPQAPCDMACCVALPPTTRILVDAGRCCCCGIVLGVTLMQPK